MAGMGFYGALAGAGGAAQNYLQTRESADLAYQREALLQQLRMQQQYDLDSRKIDRSQTMYDYVEGTKQYVNVFGQPVGDEVPLTQSDKDDYAFKKQQQQAAINNINAQAQERQGLTDYRNRDLDIKEQVANARVRSLDATARLRGVQADAGGFGRGGKSESMAMIDAVNQDRQKDGLPPLTGQQQVDLITSLRKGTPYKSPGGTPMTSPSGNGMLSLNIPGLPGSRPFSLIPQGQRGLKVGQVQGGYRYMGGDPGNKSNWQPVAPMLGAGSPASAMSDGNDNENDDDEDDNN